MIREITGDILLIATVVFCGQSAYSQDDWTPQNSGTSNTLYRVRFMDADNGYAVGDAGTVIKTTDGGANWTAVSVDTNNPIRDLSFIDDLTGWIATGDPDNSQNSGSVWKTTDGGDSWELQPLGTTQARLGVSFVSSTHGWACGANNGPWDIRATTDGGSSWHGQSGSGFGWTYDVHCVSTETGWSVGVVYYPSSTGFVIKTTNGGSSWSQLNVGNVPFLYGVQFVDSDNGYVVGDAGTVLKTTNGGSGWSDLNSGTSVNLTDISFISVSEGWVCGESGTALKTSDGGASWEDSPTGADVVLRGICFVDSVNGWVVGDGGNILKYSPEQTGLDEMDAARPEKIEISGNYPNPFNGSTLIEFRLSAAAEVNVCIYDITGRKLATIPCGFLESGRHEAIWNCQNNPSGIYFARLEATGSAISIKMMLLK